MSVVKGIPSIATMLPENKGKFWYVQGCRVDVTDQGTMSETPSYGTILVFLVLDGGEIARMSAL